jgi:mannose-6-phosphate isomerase-like protein (cupin superfamily)
MRTTQLPDAPDAIAPDGSEVRLLLELAGGSLAHFQLRPGQTAKAVRHRTVEELWFFVGGTGEMWRRAPDGRETTVAVRAGVAIDIAVGTAFQFRATGDEPLQAVGTTMPPWPGEGEAVLVDGPWPST